MLHRLRVTHKVTVKLRVLSRHVKCYSKGRPGQDRYLPSLLDHCNTPTEQTNLSPVQRLFSRRTRTLLPMSTKLLKPDHYASVKDKLISVQDRQASYYNKVSRPLPEIQPGDVVRLKLPGENVWSKVLCTSQVALRSYTVEFKGRTYRRNRKDLRCTLETPDPAPECNSDLNIPPVLQPTCSAEDSPNVSSPETNVSTSTTVDKSINSPPLCVSSSGRVIKAPKRLIQEL